MEGNEWDAIQDFASVEHPIAFLNHLAVSLLYRYSLKFPIDRTNLVCAEAVETHRRSDIGFRSRRGRLGGVDVELYKRKCGHAMRDAIVLYANNEFSHTQARAWRPDPVLRVIFIPSATNSRSCASTDASGTTSFGCDTATVCSCVAWM
jgi:hypothetical protein